MPNKFNLIRKNTLNGNELLLLARHYQISNQMPESLDGIAVDFSFDCIQIIEILSIPFNHI